MTLEERARRYVARCEPAVSGSGGHDATFKVACALVKGFELTPEQALPILREWNAGCSPPWSERDLEYKLRSAEKSPDQRPRGYLRGSSTRSEERPAAGPPRAAGRTSTIEEYDPAALERHQRHGGEEIGERWLAERSPFPVHRGGEPADFLEALYRDGERVLVFRNERTQGEWIHWVGRGSYRLGNRPGVKAAPAELPDRGPYGVWFLAQPVNGEWRINPRAAYADGTAKLSRRSAECVTAWRYMVVESDEAPAAQWLNLIVQVAMPVAALYTSGGRSIHALVRVDAKSKSDFDRVAAVAKVVLGKLGADPRAITAVRLTRLPYCYRENKGAWQRLLFLNPEAEARPILDLPRVRNLDREASDA